MLKSFHFSHFHTPSSLHPQPPYSYIPPAPACPAASSPQSCAPTRYQPLPHRTPPCPSPTPLHPALQAPTHCLSLLSTLPHTPSRSALRPSGDRGLGKRLREKWVGCSHRPSSPSGWPAPLSCRHHLTHTLIYIIHTPSQRERALRARAGHLHPSMLSTLFLLSLKLSSCLWRLSSAAATHVLRDARCVCYIRSAEAKIGIFTSPWLPQRRPPNHSQPTHSPSAQPQLSRSQHLPTTLTAPLTRST